MLLPFQGATAPTRDTQGVASLDLGSVLHWAFSPHLLNPKLEFVIDQKKDQFNRMQFSMRYVKLIR